MNRKFESWDFFIEGVRTMPLTWIPAALLVLVEEAVNRNCFNPGGLMRAIEEKLKYMQHNSKKREQL